MLLLHRTALSDPFEPEDVRFVEAVANVLASALDRAMPRPRCAATRCTTR